MAAMKLVEDDEYKNTCFVVIDFETTTPPGHRPEPIDVAAMALRLRDGSLVETSRFTALMRPPEHAPLTRFDTEQTGITADMLATRPDAGTVLAELDSYFDSPPYLLVAHNAPTEAGILYDYRAYCPRLAGTDFLDTVRLARVAFPDLASHRLDVLIHHLGIAWPANRHRAMPDVEITAELFRRILEQGAAASRWRTLRQVRADGGLQARANKAEQGVLF